MRRLLRVAALLCVLGSVVLGTVTVMGGFREFFWRSATAQWVQEPVYVVGATLTIALLCAALLLAGLAEVLMRLEEARPRPVFGPGARVLRRESPVEAPPPVAAEIAPPAPATRVRPDAMAVQRAR